MHPQNNILVLGIGNYLMGDEGVGVHLAGYLQQQGLPGADIADGGTGGFHLLDYFESYPAVILADATLDNNPAGTIRLLQPRFAKDFPKAMSTHDIGLKDMVSALQLMNKMPAIHLFTVSIESLQQQGVTLSPAIASVLPVLAQKIKNLVAAIQPPALHPADCAV